jgi:NAD(P)-dependent dehydrogenase (short-subunit alcohol dehydrogenase family)
MAQVWLVTGSSRGLGRAIVEAGLAAGNKVLATARDIKSLADLSERYGDLVKLFAMDVTDEAAAANAVMAASMYLARWMWSLAMRDMAIFRPSKTRLYRNSEHRSKRTSLERLL